MIKLFQLGFGFCKGDDNFGGRKRKELDDFLKSLGKQMNLVMYRWPLLFFFFNIYYEDQIFPLFVHSLCEFI